MDISKEVSLLVTDQLMDKNKTMSRLVEMKTKELVKMRHKWIDLSEKLANDWVQKYRNQLKRIAEYLICEVMRFKDNEDMTLRLRPVIEAMTEACDWSKAQKYRIKDLAVYQRGRVNEDIDAICPPIVVNLQSMPDLTHLVTFYQSFVSEYYQHLPSFAKESVEEPKVDSLDQNCKQFPPQRPNSSTIASELKIVTNNHSIDVNFSSNMTSNDMNVNPKPSSAEVESKPPNDSNVEEVPKVAKSRLKLMSKLKAKYPDLSEEVIDSAIDCAKQLSNGLNGLRMVEVMAKVCDYIDKQFS